MKNRVLGLTVATAAMLAAGMPMGGAQIAAQQIVSSGSGSPASPALPAGALAAARREQFISKAARQKGGMRNWPPRTVAQDKRAAKKARNRKRSKA